MAKVSDVAVVGGGAIGAFVALALARAGRKPLLLDRADIGVAAAAAGSAGHIATELIEPLPSPSLLLKFPREFVHAGGPLSIRARVLAPWVPWAWRFARAAFRRASGTRALAPLVRPGSTAVASALEYAGCPELQRRHGHYEVWFGTRAAALARQHVEHQTTLRVPCEPAPADLVREFAARANAEHAAAVWFPDSSHVVDPAQVLLEVVSAACRAGAQVQRAEVRSVESGASVIKLLTTSGEIDARQVVVCAGVHSAELLRPRGYRVPLLAARGYFVESVGDTALVDAPVVYANQRVVVTPMTGRLRLTGMMEFDRPNHPGDPRLIAILREHGRRLGYRFADTDASWTGSRPVLPDYLPAMGLLPEDSRIAYAFGHQHVGLTMAPQTADLLTALLQGQPAPIPIESFDLQRF